MDIMNLVDEEYQDLSLLFKMFSDKTRLKILVSLVNASLSVNALAELLDMSQSAISHQLATLKQMRLVRYLKKGKQVYYSLADEHVVSIIKMAYEHILE
ncbi:MAG: metalloregulator ArsR/SmtB family transcription factor [Erysipelotrichaceae bacterium]|nr:metalloregulator ArsR/SmtB family transcription factor [Erysipelotrichaceae bacterium]MDO5085081.1 metalloregulator ArsR/SmtB family transcription factor [Erysipelotrichaceae bacterium]